MEWADARGPPTHPILGDFAAPQKHHLARRGMKQESDKNGCGNRKSAGGALEAVEKGAI